MHTTKTIENIGKAELAAQVGIEASWHQDYSNSAYIFAGGLNYGMNEGDIAIVFSYYLIQRFGEIVDVHLVRDKKTGKSKGFAFLCYEDQRSTVLAVDNFNNSEICGRRIRVDHVKKYKPPKEFLELKEDNLDFESELYKPSGPVDIQQLCYSIQDGRGWGKYREYTEEEKQQIQRMKQEEKLKTESQNQMLDKIQNENEKTKGGNIILDQDERWEQIFMNKLEDEKELEAERKKIKKQLKQEKKIKKKEKKKVKDKVKKNKEQEEKQKIIKK